MKINQLSILAISALFIASCGAEPTADSSAEQAPVEKSTEKVCTYSYDATSTSINWKAFKTTAKVAVGGTFNESEVTNTVPSNSESAVFENASFSIITASVNSGNTARDPKIVSFFFNTMMHTDTIVGHVVKISEAVEGQGAAIISITMNDVTREENASYTLEGTVLTLSATINMSDWSASSAIQALNTECDALHTGDDGVSKLWEEVDISISTTLAKSCE